MCSDSNRASNTHISLQKPPRRHGPDVSIEQTWRDLSNNIREIQNHNAPNLSFEENHRFAYNMVLHKQGEMLYKGVNQLVAENLDHLAATQVIPAYPSGSSDETVQGQEAEILLKALRNIWDDHTSNMERLGQILKYMDRVYAKAADVPVIWDAGLNLFLKHIIRPPIKDHLVAAILKQIQVERDGYVVNKSAIKGCVDVFITLEDANGLSVYKRDVEPAVLRESQTFYDLEGRQLLQTCDAPEYLRRAEARFESEDSRTHHYLSRNTAPALKQILQDKLLTPHLSTVISMETSGIDAMIDLNKTSDMARLYRLFIMVPAGLPCLKRSLKDSVRRRGEAINQASSGMESGGAENVKARATSGAQTLALALKWVQDVLDLKDLFDRIWRDAFSSDRELESNLNEAFENFINLNQRSSESIALFIDDHLKRGLKGKTDTEVDLVLDKTITVFRFITEKDVFERYYKGHLAKRLLQGRSVSDDAERGMLAKLKVECGYQFTQKLEGMFNDMRISEDTMKAYRTHLSKTVAPQIDISVTVMTSTFWPMAHSASPCTLPLELIQASKSFEQFYLSQHSGRRLTWQPSLGSADVRVAFKTKKHDLNVATFALVILLLFENLGPGDFLTYEEIKQATSIEDSDLQRQLQSLACAKYKVLKKHPAGREVDPTDSFSFNADFTAPLQKIKISTVSSKVESGEERKETQDRIDEERRHQTEASIVRVMKDRKHMTHNDLVNEVTRQLAVRFLPNPLNIKKRIENLIEREYLERCDDRKSYNYMVSVGDS
ncbi:Cullin-domain-containing protein [Roridomyces roridus]|uniref:Cullin-domain-containing protein n=1 Tax=Roridomyces roridus TaxID=1738132 RepID=A0AAD7CIX9_9AGAR|nr:Cullin-domain-containing protein [Roridomyces roridus]